MRIRPSIELLEDRNMLSTTSVTTIPSALETLTRETNEMHAVTVRVEALQTEVDLWSQALLRDHLTTDGMATNVMTMQQQLTDATQSHDLMVARMQSIMASIPPLQAEQDSLEAQLTSMQTDISLIGQQITQWSAERTALQNSLATLQQSLLTLNNQLSLQDGLIANDTMDVALRQTTVTATGTLLATDQSSLQTANTNLQNAQADVIARQATLTSTDKSLTDAKNVLASKMPVINAADLYISQAQNGIGPMELDKSNGETKAGDGNTISLRGVQYPRGLGVAAPSTVSFSLNGQYTRFDSVIGVDDETKGNGSLVFQVWGDGKKLYDSGLMTGTMAAKTISIDLTGIKGLQLVVTDGGNGNTKDHADWAAARFTSVDTGGTITIAASDLAFTATTNGWGPVERDKSNGETGANDGRTISIRSVQYPKGLGVNAASSVTYNLRGQYARFESAIGVDDETNGGGSVIFQVWGDGKKLYDSGLMTGTMAAKQVSVDLTGVQSVQLVVTDGGNGNTADHADWGGARFTFIDNGRTAQRTTIATLTTQKQDAATAVTTAQNAVTTWTAAVTKATSDVARDTTNLSATQQALTDATMALTAAQADRKIITDAIAALTPQITALQLQIADKDLQMNNGTDTLNAKTTANASAEARLSEIIATVNDLNAQSAALAIEEERLRGIVTDLQTGLDADQRARDAAIADYIQDQDMLQMTQSDLLFGREELQRETADVETVNSIVRNLIESLVAQAPEQHEVTTVLPLQYAFRKIGPDSFAIDVQNLPGDRIFDVERSASKYDTSRLQRVFYTAVVAQSEFTSANGTIFFSTVSAAEGGFTDTVLTVTVRDSTGQCYAWRELDVRDITTAGLPQMTVNEVQNTVTTIVTTEGTPAPETVNEGPPSLVTTIIDGKAHVRVQGLPDRVTATIRGPQSETRDIVMPVGDGEFVIENVYLPHVLEGKCTIELFRDGQSMGAPQIIYPGSTRSFATIERSDALADSTERVTAAPEMQIIATQEGIQFRYQYLEDGSHLEIMDTDRGSLIDNPNVSNYNLTGSQGTLFLKGKMPDLWYRFSIAGPGGKLTGLTTNIYIPDNVTLIVSNPIVSTTVTNTIVLAKTSPMLWSGDLDHITTAFGSIDWAADMAVQATRITGFTAVPGDQIAGAFNTILQARIGVPTSLLPMVDPALQAVVEEHFDDLYVAYQSIRGEQNATIAAWNKHDREQATSRLTSMEVSDAAFTITRDNIVAGHRSDTDGGAGQLFLYAWSVNRNVTVGEVMGWVGKSSKVVSDALATLKADVTINTTQEAPQQQQPTANAEQLQEASMFLSAYASDIKNALQDSLSEEEINAAFLHLQNNPGFLVASSPDVFDPVIIASAYGPTNKNAQRLTVTVDWMKTYSANNLLNSVSGQGSLVTNIPAARSVELSMIKNVLPQLKAMAAVEKQAMATRTKSWVGDFQKLGITFAAGNINSLAGMGALYLQSISPVVRALNAKSIQDAINILKAANLIEYSEGNGTHPGKLVVINSGHLQTIGDENTDEDGAQKAFNEFQNSGYETLHFRVGLAFDPLMHNTSDFLILAQNILNARLQKFDAFWNSTTVSEIEMMGYSWGGGQAEVLIQNIRNQNIQIPINLALIDAVNDGYLGFLTGPSVSQRPDVTSLFNRYELQGNSTVASYILDATAKLVLGTGTSTMPGMQAVSQNAWDSLINQLGNIYYEGNPAHGMKFDNGLLGDDQREVIWTNSKKNISVSHVSIDDQPTLDPAALDENKDTNISISDAAIAFLKSK